jgi:hypothetical protein
MEIKNSRVRAGVLCTNENLSTSDSGGPSMGGMSSN